MSRGNSGRTARRSGVGQTPRTELRRWALLWFALVAAGWFYLIPAFVSAQEKKDAKPAVTDAPKPPESRTPLDAAPKGDPRGTSTGDETKAIDAAEKPFSLTDPGKAPEPREFRDPSEYEAARKEWTSQKKAFEEYSAQIAREPMALKLAKAVGHNRVSLNMMWTLITGFLVMFMQAGFAMVESGLCRAKNVSHTMAMNLMIYPLGMLGFYVCGYAFMFGGFGAVQSMGGPYVMDGVWTINGWRILGTKGFFLQGNFYDTSVFAMFFFQMVFMDTAATIPTGAAAERWKFSAFMLYGCFLGTLMYPIYGNWVWGGGWCSQLGARAHLGHGTVDFAGSSVVHLQGGIIAFWFAKMLGPRFGKYNKNGSPNVIPPHNIAMCVIGTFILAFGWFGFNAGSSLAGTELRNAMSAVNTMLASATGAVGSTLWIWKVRGNKPDTSMMCNGLLSGLVAITGPCAFVGSFSACIIGLVAGILAVESVFFIEQKLKIDDPVGAISIHGTNGLWGLLAVGIFADGSYGQGWNYVGATEYLGTKDEALKGVTGILFGDGSQLAAQAVGGVACLVYVSFISIIVFKVVDAIVGNRVTPEVEVEGLDVPEMGALGYCGIVMDKASESPVSR